MKNDKDHLDIDLEFLDKREPTKVAPKQADFDQTTSTPVSTGYKFNWKNILIIGSIVLFIVLLIGRAMFSSDDGSSSSTNTYTPPAQTSNYNTGNDDVMVGEYSCSRYNYNQATALNPDETEQQIEGASTAFEYRTNAMKRLKDEIDNLYVNDSSEQWEIDDYNAKVDDYNSKLPAYKRDLESLDSRIDQYNDQIQKYNNYLAANCTKR